MSDDRVAWPWVLLLAGAAGVGYLALRPRPEGPATALGSGGFWVAWDDGTGELWYPSLSAVRAEAKRVGEGGAVTDRQGKYVGRVEDDGQVVKG